MKSSHQYIILLATAAAAVSATAQAQQNTRPTTQAQENTRPASDASLGTISRVSKEAVSDRFTAKDLIGAAVYDSAGDKIGDVTDIDLQGTVPAGLAKAFNSERAAERSADRTMAAPTGRSAATDPMHPAGMSGATSGLSHASVFISVGGLLGVGDDLVSVPVSKINYNSSADRFEMSANKADVVALAEGTRATGYASDKPLAGTSAAKQSFNEEAMRVQKALASDPQTSAFAAKVSVSTDGDSIELRGTVDNREQQKRILEAARRSTSLDVEDKTEIRN